MLYKVKLIRKSSILYGGGGGGKFLGICAGAYYGSCEVKFETEGPLEVVGKRELQFFPGTAYGPAYGLRKFCYENNSGAQIATLDLRLKKTLYLLI